jgi:hypothetical protein
MPNWCCKLAIVLVLCGSAQATWVQLDGANRPAEVRITRQDSRVNLGTLP